MRNRVTPRVRHIRKVDDVLEMDFSTNLSPTLKAKLIGYDQDKGYFIVIKNDEWTKYNDCEGDLFWIPLSMVVTMQPLPESVDSSVEN